MNAIKTHALKLPLKILLTILVLSLIPLTFVFYISLSNIETTERNLDYTLTGVENDVLNTTEKWTEEEARNIIKQKAVDVSKQIQIYVKYHPESLTELESDEELKKIAVQPVGETGYTAVHDRNGINHFHINPKIVGFDLHNLADRYPAFWRILEKSLTQESEGYYLWEDPDGKVRKKYMYCTPINETELVVCATTYLDEFSECQKEIKNTITSHFKNIKEENKSLYISSLNKFFLIFFILTVGIVFGAIILTQAIVKPIIILKKAVEKIRKGNLNINLKTDSKDEIGELTFAFNKMVKEIKNSRKKLKKYNEELEKTVKDRTKELNKRIKELDETKLALLNMMEDMDETNKKLVKLQRELKRSLRELKEADVKKNEFISIASHELKTPLTAIHGFSQLLQSPKIFNDYGKSKKYLKIMEKETQRLSKIVNDMLSLSRIDLGTIKQNLEETDIKKFMEDIERETKRMIKEKGLKYEFKIDENLSRIITDKEKLTEILLNLINNAVKFTPKGKIIVKAFKEKNNIHFVVKDTGIGISKENQKKIFDRFYQVDSSYTRKASGTGLGLSLCKEYLELMGGRIWIKSKLGRGSEFHFIIPIKPEK